MIKEFLWCIGIIISIFRKCRDCGKRLHFRERIDNGWRCNKCEAEERARCNDEPDKDYWVDYRDDIMEDK